MVVVSPPPLPPPSATFNPHYASSQNEEDSFESSASQQRPNFHPPLGDWTKEAEEPIRSRSTTASSGPGLPLTPTQPSQPNRASFQPSSDGQDSTLEEEEEEAVAIPPAPLSASSPIAAPEQGQRLNVPSSRIFEVYTKKERGCGSGASDASSSASPLPPPLPPKADLPPPPPPPPSAVRVSAPLAGLDESLESSGLSELRHSIYTISEAGTELEEAAAREHHHHHHHRSPEALRQSGEEPPPPPARLGITNPSMARALSGGWTGTARSRSSIDSERSSVSGAGRGGAYNVREMGSLLGEAENLSDYLGCRLSPVGRDLEAEAEAAVASEAEDSVVSAASLRADQQLALYGSLSKTPTSGNNPPPPPPPRQYVSSTTEVRVETGSRQLTIAESDSLRWKKEQLRREFFGTAGSTTSVSSIGSVRQDPVKVAPVLQRPPMESGGMYGEARIGMAQVGHSHPMTQRRSPNLPRSSSSGKKPARPTAL